MQLGAVRRGLSYRGPHMAKNVLGNDLEPCGFDPVTGFYRTGCCDTGADDAGVHVVCAVMTADFLEFSGRTATICRHPSPGSPACNPATRGACVPHAGEAFDAGRAPPVRLEATHIAALEWVTLAELQANAH